MELIDKSALVAEIERWLAETDKGFPNDHNLGRFDAYKRVLSLINTLEVKEVDIDKEIGNFFGDDDWKAGAFEEEQRDMIKFAKHFFELGLKAQKGE